MIKSKLIYFLINKISEIFFYVGLAVNDNIQTTTIDSNSIIDVRVGQNNFGNKIPMYYGRSRKRRTRKQAKIGWTHLVGGQYYDGFSGSVLLVLSRGSLLPIAHSKDPSYPKLIKENTGYFDSSYCHP